MLGIFTISAGMSYNVSTLNTTWIKKIGIITSIANLLVSLLIFFLFDYSTNQFQFVKEYFEISYFDFYLGLDGLSIYFVLLTTIITPIALLSNWTSINENVRS
jgi:NADH-ubiquinone oxidoreductase chain 4